MSPAGLPAASILTLAAPSGVGAPVALPGSGSPASDAAGGLAAANADPADFTGALFTALGATALGTTADQAPLSTAPGAVSTSVVKGLGVILAANGLATKAAALLKADSQGLISTPALLPPGLVGQVGASLATPAARLDARPEPASNDDTPAPSDAADAAAMPSAPDSPQILAGLFISGIVVPAAAQTPPAASDQGAAPTIGPAGASAPRYTIDALDAAASAPAAAAPLADDGPKTAAPKPASSVGTATPAPVQPAQMATAEPAPAVAAPQAPAAPQPTAAPKATQIAAADPAGPASITPSPQPTIAPQQDQAAATAPPPPAAPANSPMVLAFAQQVAGSQASIQGRLIPEPSAKPLAPKAGEAARPAAGLNVAINTADLSAPAPVETAAAPPPVDHDDGSPDQKVASDDTPAADPSAPQFSPDPASQAMLAAAAPAALTQAQAPLPLATPQTVAQLAAAMVSQVGAGKTTRFQVQLDPIGLGKVDVHVEINAKGDLTAALNFQNPHSAQELSARASELQSALQQAGFDPSTTALQFNSGDASGQSLLNQQQQQRQDGAPAGRHGAFANLADNPDTPLASQSRQVRSGGVDVTI